MPQMHQKMRLEVECTPEELPYAVPMAMSAMQMVFVMPIQLPVDPIVFLKTQMLALPTLGQQQPAITVSTPKGLAHEAQPGHGEELHVNGRRRRHDAAT
ncbi:MAG: hypothetical protein QM775_31140 [Pirellulales bacterium]